jgi:uncharacterized membrane protein (DUF4010 family)
MNEDLQSVVGIVVAALGGAAIGIERQRSGHAVGPGARFAGIRTFTLLGLLAGIAGWLWTHGAEPLGAVLLAGAAALAVAGYVMASQRDVDGTTETAALVVLAAGALAGGGRLALASGIVSVTALLLFEKTRLHGWVARLDDAGLRASFRFGVMALVVLPLLPTGPYGPWGGLRPRELWLLVLFFSGISFAGYLARRMVGPRQGFPLTGLLGGLVSSTSVTFSFARASHGQKGSMAPLAVGVVAASTVMFVRVFLAASVLNVELSRALLPLLLAPFLVGVGITLAGMGRAGDSGPAEEPPSSPLQLRAALQMALFFQVVLYVVYWVRSSSDAGLFVTTAVLGLTDTDALTLSMAKSATAGTPLLTAARGVAVGILSNTLFKMAAAAATGRGRFRRLAGGSLAAMALASLVSLFVVR